VEPVSAKELKYLYGAYLEHCCRYYVLDAPVISDEDFDRLCRVLCEGWDTFTHRYKHLTNREALSAGTGFHIAPNEYPPALIELCRSYPNRALARVFPEE
jgi:NAD-dependent DNA ligase